MSEIPAPMLASIHAAFAEGMPVAEIERRSGVHGITLLWSDGAPNWAIDDVKASAERLKVARLPLAPVLERFSEPINSYGDLARNWCGITRVAVRAGLTRDTISWYARSGIPYWSADDLACRLGVHPSEIWGNDWYAFDEQVA